MIKINYIKTLAIGLSFVFLLPLLVSAAGIIPSDAEIRANGFCAFAKLLNNVITFIIGSSAVIAAITFSIAGAQMLMNPENPSKREEAIGMFKKTVYGLIIILVAWLIIHTVITALASNPTSALRFLDNKNCN